MKRFFKDFAVYGIASVLGKIVAVLLLPVYTGILTKGEYGAMALIMSCKGIIDLISNLNIHSGIARDYYETKDRKTLVSTGFFSIFALSLVTLLIGVASKHFWACTLLKLDEAYLPAFVLMLLSIPCGSLQSFFSILTRFNKKSVLFAVGSVLQVVISTAVSIIGVVVLRRGIASVFAGLVIGELAATLFFAFINRQDFACAFDYVVLKRSLAFSLPTLPAILAGWLDNSVGQIAIGRFVSMESLGGYSIALSFASVFIIISTAFNNVWTPYLYENYSKYNFRDEAKKLFSLMVVGLIVLSAALSLFGRELVLLLTNEAYLDSVRYIPVLCVSMSVYLLFPIASSGIAVSRQTKYLGICYLGGSLINILLLLLLMPGYGIIMVPICLALSRLITYFTMCFISEKRLELKLPNYLIFLLIAVIAICFVIESLHIGFMLKVLVFALLTAALFFICERRDLLSLQFLRPVK